MNHKHVANSYSVLGIEAVALMTDVMNRCNDPSDKNCVNATIRSTNNFTGIQGKISIDAKGKAQRPLFINTHLTIGGFLFISGIGFIKFFAA